VIFRKAYAFGHAVTLLQPVTLLVTLEKLTLLVTLLVKRFVTLLVTLNLERDQKRDGKALVELTRAGPKA
jgi:hypothetical protein